MMTAGVSSSRRWEAFSERFDRLFRRVSLYVTRRVGDRETQERIVRQVLIENRDLLVDQCDQMEELKRLKTSADRLLALEGTTALGAGTTSSAL